MKYAVSPFLLILPAALAGAAPASPGTAIVAKLYHDYAWETVLAEPGDDFTALMQAPRATLEHYFEPALAQAIADDAECAARTQEVCKLDFLPIWDGQDPGARNLAVAATDDPHRVRVRFDYPGEEKSIELTYTVADGPSGWRITDIAGDGWDLQAILHGQP
jgi:hypothetical protein